MDKNINLLLFQSLKQLPDNVPVVGLIRHAEREPFINGDFNNDVNLTSEGETTCKLLAQRLRNCLIKIYSSPVKRCLQTAYLLAEPSNLQIIPHSYLGNPGIFIADTHIAQSYFLQSSVLDIVKNLLSDGVNMPGFSHSTQGEVTNLIQFMLANATQSGLSLFITHDSILSVVLGYVFNETAIETLWPNYLECLFIWRSKKTFQGAYRTLCKPLTFLPLN